MTPNRFDPNQRFSAGGRSQRSRPAPVSHQTVKLSRGTHHTPEEGACVMELASMLAGESFTDHPKSVCPVIASLLRAYDDAVDDHRRQDMYACASKVVGSRRSEVVQRAREERLAAWTRERRRRWWTRFLHPFVACWSALRSRPGVDVAATRAIRAISRDMDHAHVDVLALIDELVALDLGDDAPLIDRIKGTPPFDVDRSGYEGATIRWLGARDTAT